MKRQNLPLTQSYELIGTNYVPIQDGGGTTCDNCGTLIANIATVKGGKTGVVNQIGFDCLKRFMDNNALLSEIDVAKFSRSIQSVKKVGEIRKYLKESLEKSTSYAETIEIELAGHHIILSIISKSKKYFNRYWTVNTRQFDRDLLVASIKSLGDFDFESKEDGIDWFNKRFKATFKIPKNEK